VSATYRAIGWNAFKKRYDLVLAGAVVLFLGGFVVTGSLLHPAASTEIQWLRATGAAAITLLHVILLIGPMARLRPQWLPLLYNRRHLGVTLFFVALVHGALAIAIHHGNTGVHPVVSVFVTDAGPGPGEFPFQACGLVALGILGLLAATSHDFWLANLTSPVWKSLHLLVYAAYGLVVLHVAFGALRAETSPLYAWLIGGGVAMVSAAHLLAGWRQAGPDREPRRRAAEDGFVPVCAVADLVENVPLGVTLGGERVAVLRYDGNKVSAVSGVCQHQNGPLAEGRYVRGCLTCPWHGYQYDPATGRSPAPFTEKVPTFRVRLADGLVHLHPRPEPAGTPVPPALVTGEP
jgi:nitrite reductase/ring-hydroxylating ferredoxin subunit/DMSO/TMAO reductase YedYZ heme-binding membrane subunit